MSSRIRPGAYKKSLVSEDDCLSWSLTFSERVSRIVAQKKLGILTDAEFAALYVLAGLQILRPNDWRGGAHKSFDFKPTDSEWINTFLNHSLRSIPISVNRSLYLWQTGKYPLKLYYDVPSPLEVLRLQSAGYRCVSCVTDSEMIKEYILGERDALSFALHDLIHADHFFKHPEWMQAQVGFSRWMLKLYSTSKFNKWLNQDAAFEKEFFYAASDMNSHPAHMAKYFKSVLTAAILRSFRQDPTEKLSETQHEMLKHWLLETSLIGEFDQGFYQALRDLNTSAETDSVLRYLTEGLNAKGYLEGSATGDNNKDRGVPFVVGSSVGSKPWAVVGDRLNTDS